MGKQAYDNMIDYLKLNTNLTSLYHGDVNDFNPVVKFKLKCDCGNEFYGSIRYIRISKMKMCKKCRSKILTYRKIKLLKELEELVKTKYNGNIEISLNVYTNVKDRNIKCYCKIHDIYYYNSVSNLQNSSGCMECFKDSRKGDKNPAYKHNKIRTNNDYKQSLRANLKQWRIELLKKYNSKCYICGHNKKYNLIAHHKNSFDIHEDERYLVENGVILCKNCHSEFHYIYGYGNNTKEQFDEYVNSFKEIE